MTDERTPADAAPTDDLQDLIRHVEAARPEVRHQREDLQELHKILDELVALRRTRRLSQGDVAKILGVKQPTISQFENESSDPRVSTLQRYARALGTKLTMAVGSTDQWTVRGYIEHNGTVCDYAWSGSHRILAISDCGGTHSLSVPIASSVPVMVSGPETDTFVEPPMFDLSTGADSHRADFALSA